MLYYDNEWKICPFIAHYKSYGKPEFKYTNNKQWWIEFVNRWWHHTDLSFTDVNPTEAQQTRLDEVNAAPIPEGFQAEASAYVESGLVLNPDNPHFAGFTESPEEMFPSPAPVGTLQTDKWTITADEVDEALVAYSSDEVSVTFSVDGEAHSVITEQKFNGRFAILEVSADGAGPINISVQDKIITLKAEVS